MAPPTPLRFDHVWFKYRHAKRDFALREIDLTVEPGETLALVGHNGAGKTTLLLLASTLLVPTHGNVSFGPDAETKSRADIALLTEKLSLYDRFTVFETLEMVGRVRRIDALDATIEAAIEGLQLSAVCQREVGQLSTGLRKRTAIAASILGDPQLLLLDEPFASIDPESVEVVSDLVRRRGSDGKVTVIASHDLPEVDDVADRVAVLESGTIRGAGDVRELVSLSGGARAIVSSSEGTIPVPLNASVLAETFAELDRRGASIRAVSTETASLTDAYWLMHRTGSAAPLDPQVERETPHDTASASTSPSLARQSTSDNAEGVRHA